MYGGAVGFTGEAEEDLASGFDCEGNVWRVSHGVAFAGGEGCGGQEQGNCEGQEVCFSLHESSVVRALVFFGGKPAAVHFSEDHHARNV